MTILMVAFAAAAVIFGIFGLSLYTGSIGLIKARYWGHIPEAQRMGYCRRMGAGTILLGAAFLVGAFALLITNDLSDYDRMVWSFGIMALSMLPGVVVIFSTNQKFGRNR